VKATAAGRKADSGLADVDRQAGQDLDATLEAKAHVQIHRHYGETPLVQREPYARVGGTFGVTVGTIPRTPRTTLPRWIIKEQWTLLALLAVGLALSGPFPVLFDVGV
jgi:hypothetical protein